MSRIRAAALLSVSAPILLASLYDNRPAIPADLGFDSGSRRVFVNGATGSDSNDGLSSGTAKETIQGGVNIAQAGDVITVADGTYAPWALSNVSGTASERIWLVAENRGQVIVSNMWAAALAGTEVWADEGGGTWSATHGNFYVGSYDPGDGAKMLFHFDSQASLEATTVEGIDHPGYGLAHETGTVYIRLPGGADPNNETIYITDSETQILADFNNCDYWIIDGFVFQGAGTTWAIDFDSSSESPIIRNCVAEYSRGLARIPDNTLMEWCEYTFPGQDRYIVDLIVLNGDTSSGFFDLVKDHYASGGNALLEGGMYETSSNPSENCEFRYCYIHEVFDGERAGCCNNSKSHHNRYERNADNDVEFEHFASTSPAENLEHYCCLHLDPYDAPLSHQDATAAQDMRGPHYIYRNVVSFTLARSHPFALIKNRRLHPTLFTEIAYYHNWLERGDGSSSGFGTIEWIWWDANDADQNSDFITLQNNIIIAEGGITESAGDDPVSLNNALVNTGDYAAARGTNGIYLGTSRDDVVATPNFTLKPDSPVRRLASAVDPAWPDNSDLAGISNAADDIGCFPYGYQPGKDWPRPGERLFDTNPPAAWTPSAVQIDAVSTGFLSTQVADVQASVGIAAVHAGFLATMVADIQSALGITAAHAGFLSTQAAEIQATLEIEASHSGFLATQLADVQTSVGITASHTGFLATQVAEIELGAFVSVWDTENTSTGSSASDTVTLPLESDGTYAFHVDWGDGSSDDITAFDDAAVSHTYSVAGTYTITITGTIDGWRFNNTGDRLKLEEIQQWGPLRVGSNQAQFFGCENMAITATDELDVSGETELGGLFRNCFGITTPPVTTNWDVSSCLTFRDMFRDCSGMTTPPDTSLWVTTVLDQVIAMFRGSGITSPPDVSGWDMSVCTTFREMFRDCSDLASPPDVSGWDTGACLTFDNMFRSCTSMTTAPDVSLWDTAACGSFAIMFLNCVFDTVEVDQWDISALTDASSMFQGGTLTTTKYNEILVAWEAQAPNTGVPFHGGGSTHSGAGTTARDSLTGTYTWSITDGGPA